MNKNTFTILVASTIAMFVGIVTLGFMVHSISSDNKMLDAKNTLLQSDINKKSDIELLEFRIKEADGFAEYRLETIAEIKEALVKEEGAYEHAVLTKRCNMTQLDRKLEGLEYSLEYCTEDANLEQFREKK